MGGRDVILVEGERTKQGIGNDLFNNTKSIKRIICPRKNSFQVYNKILNTILKFNKKYLILISLGPNATILSYDLCKIGYQAVDIGHINLEYKFFLRNVTKNKLSSKKKIKTKEFLESQKIYYKQIYKRIK